MSIKKISKSKIAKTFLLAIVFSFIFFIGINKSMALMIINLESDLGGGYTCPAGQLMTNGICRTPTYISPGVAPIPPPSTLGSPWNYTVSWDTYMTCLDSSCGDVGTPLTQVPAGSANVATFAVNTNKLTYAPGETVIVSVAGAAGDQGNTFNGWSGIVNNVLCFFFGCSAPKGIEVDANFAGISVAHCGGSGSCSNGAGQTFTAPLTAGTYTILLTGCYAYAGQCNGSSITFDVIAPQSIPQVNVWLGTSFNKVKFYLKSIFSKSEKINLVS